MRSNSNTSKTDDDAHLPHSPLPPKCSSEMRQLYRELIPGTFEKCMSGADLYNWNDNVHGNILECGVKLGELVAVKLANVHAANEESEEDLLHLLQALPLAFDRRADFYKKHRHDEIPREHPGVADAFAAVGGSRLFAALQRAAPRKMNARAGTFDDDAPIRIDQDDEEEEDEDEDDAMHQGTPDEGGEIIHRWLCLVIDHFGNAGGFDAVLEMLHDPTRVTLRTFDAVMTAMARCAIVLDDQLLARFEENAQVALDHLQDIVTRGDSSLVGSSPSERDRRYLHLGSALRSLRKVLSACVGDPEAEKRVSRVERAMVEGMLSISTFNMQLIALREINLMLATASNSKLLGTEESASAMQTAVKWLDMKKVLPHVLRPVYLHHKQYVDQVAAVLRFLLKEDALAETHVDMLWDITQKQDTFEEVKHNVYDLLTSLAWHFNGDQLDQLFLRFESAGGGMTAADSGKLSEMIQKLARGDNGGQMAERLLALLWRMVHAGETGAAGLEMIDAFAHVLGHYDWMEIVRKEEYLRRQLLEDLRNGPTSDLAIPLQLSKAILMHDTAYPNGSGDAENGAGAKGKRMLKKKRKASVAREQHVSRRDWLRRVDEENNLTELLVSSLERYQAAAWSDGADAPHGISLEDYFQTYIAFLDTIEYVLKNGEMQIEPAMGDRMWTAVAETSTSTADAPRTFRDQGLKWIKKLLTKAPCSVTEDSVLHLLGARLVHEPAEKMTKSGWSTFRTFFMQAGLDSGKLVFPEDDSEAPELVFLNEDGDDGSRRVLVTDHRAEEISARDIDLVGLDQLWRISLDTSDDAVADDALNLLIQLHTDLAVNYENYVTNLHRDFLASTLDRLREAAKAMDDAGDDAVAMEMAEQRADRCIRIARALILETELGGMMPGAPLPHGATFPGNDISIEIIPPQNIKMSRFKLASNTHELVKTVRENISREIDFPSNRFRLIFCGKIVEVDNWLMRETIARGHDVFTSVFRMQVQLLSPDNARPRHDFGVSSPASLPRSLLANQPGAYDVFLKLAESRGAQGDGGSVQSSAQQILLSLPTQQQIKVELCALLAGGNVAAGAETAAAAVVAAGESSAVEAAVAAAAIDPARAVAMARARLRELLSQSPARLVYTVQVLDGLLSPVNNDDVDDTARLLRASFSALGCTRDILAVFPPGSTGVRATSDDGVDDDAAGLRAVANAGAAAWSDASMRCALCSSALSLLKQSHPIFGGGDSAKGTTEASLGSLGGAIGGMSVATPTGSRREQWSDEDLAAAEASESSVDASCVPSKGTAAATFVTAAPLAIEAVPTLMRLAYTMSTGLQVGWELFDDNAMDEDGVVKDADDAAGGVQREDVFLSFEAIDLLLECLKRSGSNGAVTLLEQPLFSSMLRDLVIRSPLESVRHRMMAMMIKLMLITQGDGRVVLSPPPGMLKRLLAARVDADAHPKRCKEFFILLNLVIRDSGGSPEENSECDAVAETLLASEVEALRVSPPAIADADTHLQSRLRLIQCLVERLDRRSVGSKAAGLGLVQVLMFRCLFPEAVPMLLPSAEVLRLAGMPAPVVSGDGRRATHVVRRHTVAAAGGAPDDADADKDRDENDTDGDDVTLTGEVPEREGGGVPAVSSNGVASVFGVGEDVEMLEEHLTAVCSTPNTRQAAFQLLADLASHDTENMLEVTETLMNLHYRGSVDLNEWEQLPINSPRPPGGYVGLKNAGATCYMNSVFQQLYMMKPLRNAVLSVTSTAVTEDEQKDSVFYQFQMMIASLAASHVDHYAPRGFWRAFKDYDGEPINVREHQDGFEFFTRLQDMIDSEFKKAVAIASAPGTDGGAVAAPTNPPPGVKGAMEAVLGGKFVNQVLCQKCPAHRSEREEDFVNISVDIRNKRDLNESLASYVSGELLEADNQWHCEQCGCNVDAVKRICFKQLPHTLCVHLKRFEFDYETMQRLKVKDRFEFPMRLDMSPFTVEGIEREAATAEAETAGDAPAPVPELIHPLDHYQYKLVGVVVHSGTAFAGHYYSYIREREAPPGAHVDDDAAPGEAKIGERWHVYDDQRVEPYDVSCLEADTFGGKYGVNIAALGGGAGSDDEVGNARGRIVEHDRPNSAYMLFYERVNPVDSDEVLPPPSRVATPAIVEKAKEDDEEKAIRPGRHEIVPIPSMPRKIRGEVMTQNLQFVFNGNLFSREYFAFVQQLVESTLQRGNARKSQRRGALGGPSGGGRGDEGDGGGSDARVRSQEEEDERAVLSVRIATEFLCHVYLRAHHSMRERESLMAWRDTVAALLERSAAACLWFLDFLRDRPGYLAAFLARCPSADARETFANFVAAALRSAVTRDGGGATAEALLLTTTVSGGGGGGSLGGGVLPATTTSGSPSPAAANPTADRRQPAKAARLVDRVLHSLIQVLNDAAAHPSKLTSPSYYFAVLYEYAALGPGQRLQLLQYDVLRSLCEFVCAASRRRVVHHQVGGGVPHHDDDDDSSSEMKPAYDCLHLLVASCDLTEVRREKTQILVDKALEITGRHQGGASSQNHTWHVGDLIEDGGGGGGFHLPLNLTGGVFERAFLEHLTGIAASGGTHKSNETAMKILLHSCHSWQWASRVCIFVLLDRVRTEEATSGVAPALLVAEHLVVLADWCASARVTTLLAGFRARNMPPYIAVEEHEHGIAANTTTATRTGLLEIAAHARCGRKRRYLIVRALVKLGACSATVRHVLREDADDFFHTALTLLQESLQGQQQLDEGAEVSEVLGMGAQLLREEPRDD